MCRGDRMMNRKAATKFDIISGQANTPAKAILTAAWAALEGGK
ncbi:MAG: hypothetical protein WC503_00925 [Candidatus Shapirobacteria bacterium]